MNNKLIIPLAFSALGSASFGQTAGMTINYVQNDGTTNLYGNAPLSSGNHITSLSSYSWASGSYSYYNSSGYYLGSVTNSSHAYVGGTVDGGDDSGRVMIGLFNQYAVGTGYQYSPIGTLHDNGAPRAFAAMIGDGLTLGTYAIDQSYGSGGTESAGVNYYFYDAPAVTAVRAPSWTNLDGAPADLDPTTGIFMMPNAGPTSFSYGSDPTIARPFIAGLPSPFADSVSFNYTLKINGSLIDSWTLSNGFAANDPLKNKSAGSHSGNFNFNPGSYTQGSLVNLEFFSEAILTPYDKNGNAMATLSLGSSTLTQSVRIGTIDNGGLSGVPEPSTYGLLGAASLAGYAFLRKRRMRAPQSKRILN